MRGFFHIYPKSPDIITDAFYSQDNTDLIIHYDRYISHMVFDSGFRDPLVIVGSGFFPAVASDTLPREVGNIIWCYCMYGCTDDIFVKGSRISLLFEHDVSGAFDLPDNPCMSRPPDYLQQENGVS